MDSVYIDGIDGDGASDDGGDVEDECWWILVQLGRRGMSPLGIHHRPSQPDTHEILNWIELNEDLN